MRDLTGGLEIVLARGAGGLLLILFGLLLGWWLYVPVHELAHAAACVAAGGTVGSLEINPLYGGRLLARVLPFVVAESQYAGRLASFDTGGSDLVYLATDLGPFLLALPPGLWLLRRAAGAGRAFLFGLALPFALSPFLSLTGDAYEIGSLLVRQLPPWSEPALAQLLVGDDLLRRAREVAAAAAPPWGGFAIAIALGAVWAWASYVAASVLCDLLGEPPLSTAGGRAATPSPSA